MTTQMRRRFRVVTAQDRQGKPRAIRVYENAVGPGKLALETALGERVVKISRGVYDLFEIVDGRPIRTRLESDDPSAP